MRVRSVLVMLALSSCSLSTEYTADEEAIAAPEMPPADPPESENPPVEMAAVDEPAPVFARPGGHDVSVWAHAGEQDDVWIRFSDVMVATVDEPIPEVSMTPAVDGMWRWRDVNTLAFEPTDGSLPPGTRVQVQVAHERVGPEPVQLNVATRPFYFAGKVANWPVIPGKPRFVGFLNMGSLSIGDGPLLLLFDQPVDAQDISRGLRVTDSLDRNLGIRLEELDVAPWAWREPFPPGHVVAVRVPGLPEEGYVDVNIPSGEDFDAWQLQVRRNLSMRATGWYGETDGGDAWERLPTRATVQLESSQTILTDLLEEGLRIEPEPLDVSISAWGSSAQLRLHLEQGQEYNIQLAGAKDVLGNELSEAFDLTFRTQDKVPNVDLPAQAVTIEAGRAELPIRWTNVQDITARARRVATEDLARALGSGGACAVDAANAISLPVALADGELNQEQHGVLTLPDGAGAWCVEVTAQPRGSEAATTVTSRVLVQAATTAMTAKVSQGTVHLWATELATGRVRAGLPVSVRDVQGRVLHTGTTDADGVVALPVPTALATGVRGQLVVTVDAEREPMALLVEEGRLSAPWQFGLPGAIEGREVFDASVFTERGAYRPGDTVHLTVVSGPEHAGESVYVEVIDAQGQEAVSQNLSLDAFGVGHIAVETQPGSSVGSWRAQVTGDAGGTVDHRFRVEEYRVPTFEVAVEGPAQWAAHEAVAVDLSAAYLHGGLLDGRAIRWEVRREAVPFTPAGYARYRFADERASRLSGTVASGEDRLDGTGHHSIAFTPDHPASSGAVRYTVDATVTDVDRQAYLGRTARTVHPAAFYVGVQPPVRSVLTAGETLSVPVVALTPDGIPRADVPVRVRLERIDSHVTTRMGDHSGQTLNRDVPVQVEECLVTTRDVPVMCEMTVPSAGRWAVRAWARDANGHDVASGFSLHANGESMAAWPRFDHERIAVVADKVAYEPGETARLLIESPFEEATALVTLERDGVLSHRVVAISGNTPSIEVPITEEHAPNVFATVSLVRGRAHDLRDASGFPTGAPAFRLGSTELSVSRRAQRLAVDIEPTEQVAAPGDEVAIDLRLTNASGEPVTGQAVVMVVDEAVLGLTAMQTPDPLAGMMPNEPLGVRTADSRLELPHARRARHEVLFPGGDGGVIEGQLPANRLRELFESTAFFDAQVPVTNGVGRVQLTLPDNTTTWRVMAVVVDEAGHGGSADTPIVVRKPVMVQAVTPRFAYAGDQMTVEALVHNGTETEGTVTVSGGATGGQGQMAATQVRVPAGGTATVPMPLTVERGDGVVLRLHAEMGEHRDDLEVTVPVLEPGFARTQVLTAQLRDTAELDFTFPDDRVRGSETLEIVASTTALTELRDAVDYLMGYPNGCIEQTTSRAYPLVMLEDLLPQIGVEVDPVELRTYSEAGIARILSFQTSGGGLSYWPGGTEPHAFATSFGLTALIEAKKKGYHVPDEALVKMGDYLVDSLSRGDVTESIPHGNIADGDTRALFVMTLGRLGRPQPAWIERLWSEKDKLTPFGLSFLGVAAVEMNADHPLKDAILAEVERRAEQDADEAWYEGSARGGYSMDSPLRSHASALLASATANGDLSGKYLRGLLERRRNGLWGNTQENVFGIMAISTLAASGPPGDAPGLQLSRNGQSLDVAAMAAPSSQVRRQRWTSSELSVDTQRIAAVGSGQPTTLTLRATYDLQLTPENREPTASGATVTRTYTTLDGQALDGEVPLGSLVLVTLDVTTDNALNYVAVDDKLPAGLEPLNASLATTERVDLGTLPPEVERGLGLLSYQEIRDHRVAFYADELPAGDISWQYVARATTPGTFLRPAARVEAMYDADTFASSAVDTVVVR